MVATKKNCSRHPVDIFGTVVGENPDHVCWAQKIYGGHMSPTEICGGHVSSIEFGAIQTKNFMSSEQYLCWRFSLNIVMLSLKYSVCTVEQQIFACMKFSRISRISGDSRKFPAREYYLNKVRTSAIQKFAKISCTPIACGRKSRKFPVAKISCSTVL